VPQEPFATVTAKPAAALNQVREVMLIWPGEPKDTAVDATVDAADDANDDVPDIAPTDAETTDE
jgi:hypothetical protein